MVVSSISVTGLSFRGLVLELCCTCKTRVSCCCYSACSVTCLQETHGEYWSRCICDFLVLTELSTCQRASLHCAGGRVRSTGMRSVWTELVWRSAETVHCDCLPASIRYTKHLISPQQCWSIFHSSGVWRRVGLSESTNISEEVVASVFWLLNKKFWQAKDSELFVRCFEISTHYEDLSK
jgi:hypothetical protein